MKKNIFITALLLILFSVAAKAQSTYSNPYRNATHSYIASVTDAGNNNPVRWYVTTDADGLSKAEYGVDYSFVTAGYNAGSDQLESTAVYTVQITWGSSIIENDNYYVFLEVDDDLSGCTNRMALAVEVAAGFNALVYDVTGSSTPGTQDPGVVPPASCPDDVENPIWNAGSNSHTDIGFTELIFRVDRTFSLAAWQFQYQLKEGTGKSFNLENIRLVDAGGTTLHSGTNLTGTTLVDSDENYVLVYVQITNQQGVTLDVDFDLITTSNSTKDADDNLDSNAADNLADHTIQPMPVISGFGGN